MHWTLVCDFPFVRYQAGRAVDVSDFHNDAQIAGTVVPNPGFVRFQAGDAQLIVPVQGDSLQRFMGLAIEARVCPLPAGRRQNIVEGWMSFALFIEPDQRLVATIYDGQTWVGVQSPPGTVPFGQWSDVSFEYDGICTARLELDGAVVGSSITMPVGMRQPHQNVTIGHWPAGDDRYTFTGDIGRVTILRRDYEDLWRDAADSMLCNRRLSPAQVVAMKEIAQHLESLDGRTMSRLRQLAAAQTESLFRILHRLRAGNRRRIADHRRFGNEALAAWCCGADLDRLKAAVLRFVNGQAGAPGTRQREEFKSLLTELTSSASPVDWNRPPFDRIRELFLTVIPESAFAESWLNHLRDTIVQDG